ncbi:M48 family metalloprotease [Streptomyces sp. NPDC046881]|uniref:M48 family metalloprotease n=1 Tax=Streptomyces sp. NPDC046881 TaxID=3155374 RepID=UPI0033E63DE1
MVSAESRDLVARASTRRFLLLVTVLLASTTALVSTSTLTILSLTSLPHCAAAAGVDVQTPAWRALLTARFHEDLTGCRSDAARIALYAALSYTCIVAGAAVALFWQMSHRPLGRGRYTPLLTAEETRRAATAAGPPDAPNEHDRNALARHLAGLVRQAGVPSVSTPAFVVDPRAMSAGAVTFGRADGYTVCLHAGLLVRRATAPSQFDAVVLHELAHVRNGDVDLAYFTVALWRVFLGLVLGPYLLLNVWLLFQGALGTSRVYWDGGAPGPAAFALAAGLVVQTYLAHADILRHRELVADHDAMMYGADPSVWAAQRPGDRRGATLTRLTRIWRSHPDWAERHRMLTHPPEVDKGGTKLQFLLFVGAYATLLYTVLVWLDNEAVPQRVVRVLAYLASPLVIATAVGVLPRRKPRPTSFTPAERDGPRLKPESKRAWRIGVAVTISFFITDPLAGMGEDSSGYEAPAPLGVPWMQTRPSYDPDTRARMTAWFEGGGTDLLKRFDAALTATLDREDGSDQHQGCAALRRTMSEALTFPLFPAPVGADDWRQLLTSTAEGFTIQCRPGSQNQTSRRLAADRWYMSAGTACASLMGLRPTPSAEPTGHRAPG